MSSAPEHDAVTWTFDARELAGESVALEATLSREERERADRFVRLEPRFMYVVGRGVLRRLLGAELGCRPEEVRITYGQHGKPAVDDATAPSFNLSNSGSRIAIALAYGSQVGIDVEQIRGGEWLDLAARYFASSEREYLRARPSSDLDRAFLEVWTRKEAYIKALGGGLSIALESFSVPLGAIASAGTDMGDWRMYSLPMPDGYVGACALRAGARLACGHVMAGHPLGRGRQAAHADHRRLDRSPGPGEIGGGTRGDR